MFPHPRDRQDVLSPRASVQGGAFSLVEVVIAIGLTTFAMLVLFSLLPVGLVSLQDTNRQIVETEIFNTVGAELSSTPFEDIANYQSTRFPIYLSNEGEELKNTNDMVFFVRCSPPVPGPNPELSRVTVSIGFHRDPDQQNAAAQISKRSFLLANRGTWK